MDKESYTIGFANLDERNSFAVSMRKGLEVAVSKQANVNLITRDNALDMAKAKANIEEFVNLPVDLAVIFHIDEREGGSLIVPLTRKNIPVISVVHAIPMTTYFGLDTEQAGQVIGEDLVKWIQTNWDGQVDKVLALTNMRAVNSIPNQIGAALKELLAHTQLDEKNILYFDDGGLPEVTYERVHNIIQCWSEFHRIVVIALGDHIALAAFEAVRALGREADTLFGGMDGLDMAVEELNKLDSRLLYSLAFDSEGFGERLLGLALRTLQGEKVPRAERMPFTYLRDHSNTPIR
jgi:ABC-type sugar transport system substrate-binding protein